MKILRKKTIAAALALLMLTAASASATSSTVRHIKSPAAAKKQLNTIAEAEKLWKDEFAMPQYDDDDIAQLHLLSFTPSQTYFAVTDLDGNGRLELLFRHAAMLSVKEGITPYPLRDIPTAVAMAVYEVDTDGRLAPHWRPRSHRAVRSPSGERHRHASVQYLHTNHHRG